MPAPRKPADKPPKNGAEKKAVATIPLRTAQWRLAALWSAAFGIAVIFLLVRTLAGAYGDKADEAWSWFSPLMAPTLGLIFGVLAKRTRASVEKGWFWIAFGFSALYLVLLLIAMVPITENPFDQLRVFGLVLGIMQAPVGATLGYLFVKNDKP